MHTNDSKEQKPQKRQRLLQKGGEKLRDNSRKKNKGPQRTCVGGKGGTPEERVKSCCACGGCAQG